MTRIPQSRSKLIEFTFTIDYLKNRILQNILFEKT